MKKLLYIIYFVFISNIIQAKSDIDTFYSLPFRLVTFSARVANTNEVKLFFTNAETFPNVTHFEVLRSTNNIDFTVIGIVNQTDDSPISHSYEFTDRLQNTVTSQTIYYRLKQVVTSQIGTYSFILPVKLKTNEGKSIKIWPIPSVNEININFENTENDYISLKYYNANGVLMHQEKIESSKGNCTVKSTAIKDWKSGNYYLQILSGNIVIGSTNFIKIK